MKFNLAQLFRFFVGTLFVFSGFVKAVDPIGTAIKLDKYFIAWAEQTSDLFLLFTSFSLPLSYFVVSFELVLGIALLLNFKKLLTVNLLVAIIVFFTLLTFYTAVTGKPTDCGCFGDFLIISPWASFAKDVVLLFMIIYLKINSKNLGSEFSGPFANYTLGAFTILTFYFSYYNIVQLPLIDFRPYKLGQDLEALVVGTPAKYEYQLRSKKSNEVIQVQRLINEQFITHDYIGQVEVAPGKEAKILEFRIDNELGENVTDQIFIGKKALFVIRKLKDLTPDLIKLFNKTKVDLESRSYDVYLLTGFSRKTYLESNQEVELLGSFSSIDEDVSKAMIRAGNGLVLIENAIVKGKYPIENFNSSTDL